MPRLPLLAAFAPALLLASALSAQNAPQSCPGGRDDSHGMVMTARLAAHPSRAGEMMDSVLAQAGYIVRSTPPGEGEWGIAPRFTFVEGLNPAAMSGVAHPGVQLSVSAHARGDSTEVEVGANTLCRTMRDGRADEEAETAIELVHAMMVISALTERAEALESAGTDLAAPVERRPRYSLSAPDEVASFRRISRHDYDDPAAGVNMRYGRDDGSYIDLYVYPGTPPECDAACGARHVNEEADGFITDIPEIVQRGYYGRMKVTADETLPVPPGAPWLFGRHMTMEVEVRGETQESQYYLFAFPGYKVKLRATVPPSAEMTAAVRAFADALLPAMVAQN
jgi:hypothetical protein